MQTVVKSWSRDKECGVLDNGGGPEIMVLKSDLIGCHYLKVGANVEFECHLEKNKLCAKKVRLLNRKKNKHKKNDRDRNPKRSPFGVMT